MTKETLHFDTWVASQQDAWNSRGKDPLAPTVLQEKEYNDTPLQRDIDMAHAMDKAAMEGDTFAMFEAQMAMMPPAARAEVRASLPFPAQEFIA